MQRAAHLGHAQGGALAHTVTGARHYSHFAFEALHLGAREVECGAPVRWSACAECCTLLL